MLDNYAQMPLVTPEVSSIMRCFSALESSQNTVPDGTEPSGKENHTYLLPRRIKREWSPLYYQDE